jgi:hypothetical protein
MTVTLFMPVSTSMGSGRDQEVLLEGPRFVRTRAMSRWHRVRAGVRHIAQDRISYHLWCGGGFVTGDFLARDEPLPGELVCGPCDGRAVGSGQEPNGPADRELTFTPRYSQPPRNCPGSRKGLFTEFPGGRVGSCLVCGDLQPLRSMGGPYNGRFGIVQHGPGQHLVTGCPFHAWQYLGQYDGQVVCSPCGTPLTHTPEGS